MAIVDFSNEVLNQCFARLSDPVKGFNPLYASLLSSYTPELKPIVLDFTGPSVNFAFMQLEDADMLEQSGFVKYPFVNMYTLESANRNLEKFNKFAGQVRVGIEFWLSFPKQRQTFNYEAMPGCVEAVMYHIYNRQDDQGWQNNVVYNGNMSCRKAPLRFAGENWRQRLGFSLIFEARVL